MSKNSPRQTVEQVREWALYMKTITSKPPYKKTQGWRKKYPLANTLRP